MKTFQNGKKLFGMVAVFITLIFLSACFESPFIIPSNNIIAPTKDELIDLYWEYKEELTEVAEIILASDPLRKELIGSNEDEWDVNSYPCKKYFSEEDWEKIVDLYKKICPYTIERRATDAICISFALRKVDGGEMSASLHYKYKAGTWPYDAEHLDGDWYIREHFYKD